MKEIGGYIELDTYRLPLLHGEAKALNCGRNCLAYLFRSRGIKKIRLPYFICGSVCEVCDREHVQKSFYHIGPDFRPIGNLCLENDEWLYLVNFYGQIGNDDLEEYVRQYSRVIVDQAQAYFEKPAEGADTIYTCRKWFGVADGAFLYTDSVIDNPLPQDESYDRMHFLLGRFERNASDFYKEYSDNNRMFADEPIKRMSKLTRNLLSGIDYPAVAKNREDNFNYLHERLGDINQLNLKETLFMYPLMIENGSALRKKLQQNKIYIPTLWPDVFDLAEPDDLEYKMAENILPLPIDQRYDITDMQYMISVIIGLLEEK